MDTLGPYSPHLGFFVVISVRIVSHVFTKNISRVFVRGNNIRRLPFSIPVNKDYKNNIYSGQKYCSTWAHKLCVTLQTLFSHLQAGSAPASISTLTVACCAAAEAMCSKVNPDESRGSLSSDRGLETVDEWLSDCSWVSGVCVGSWRSVHRVSTSPTLHAVNKESLRQYSTDSSAGSPVVASKMSSFMPSASVLHNSVKQIIEMIETGWINKDSILEFLYNQHTAPGLP